MIEGSLIFRPNRSKPHPRAFPTTSFLLDNLLSSLLSPAPSSTARVTLGRPAKMVSIRASASRANVSPVSKLPEEVLSRILRYALAQPWPFSFDTTRSDALLVCSTFHRLGRDALCEHVLLSNTHSFHNFFCVDDTDWEVYNGLVPIEADHEEHWEQRWRDMDKEVLKRRERDWTKVWRIIHCDESKLMQRKVKHLTIDSNFAPAIAMEFEYARRYVIPSVPYLWNSFGRFVKLQDAAGTMLLPNLQSLIISNTSDSEDWDTYKLQTRFRFDFIGSFSPQTFGVPAFTSLSLRLLRAPAMRFPPSLLNSTSTLVMRDFVDLEDFFPFATAPPPHLRETNLDMDQYFNSGAIRKLEHVSLAVTTLICCSEDFAYHLEYDEFFGYLGLSINTVVRQFPNLQTLHLPRVDAFYQTVEGRSEECKAAYINAIKVIIADAEDAKIRQLEVILDQAVTY